MNLDEADFLTFFAELVNRFLDGDVTRAMAMRRVLRQERRSNRKGGTDGPSVR